MAGAVGAALATAAASASVGTVAASTPLHSEAGPLTVAWSGSPFGGSRPGTARREPPPPPSWTGGLLPSARHGTSVGDQLRSHPDRRARAAADLFGTAALHGDLPASMQGAVAGIPSIVLDAYRQAAATMDRQDPRCGVPWWLLAGIGRIESGHAADGRVDAAGTTRGAILGPRLDGSMPGTSVISDSDGGRLDGDPNYDRAVGPMQFLPSTWAGVASDGNGDGVRNPNNVFDASLGAARYLCAGGGNLRTLPGLTAAVLRYNASMSYVRSVLTWGTAYRDEVSVTRPAPGRVPSGDPRLPADTPQPKPRHERGGEGPSVLAGGHASDGHGAHGGGGQDGSGSSGKGGSGSSGTGGPAGSGRPGPSPSQTQPPSRPGGNPTSSPSGTTSSSGRPPTTAGPGSATTATTGPVPTPTPTGPVPSTGTPDPSGSGSSGSTTPPPSDPPPPTPTPTGSPSPADGAVNGRVWADTNPNGTDTQGIQDAGEPGMPDIGVHLIDAAGTVVANGSTDLQSGTFSLSAPPGDYTLLVELPVGAAFTTENVGGDADGYDSLDSDVDPAGRVEVTLSPGGHVTMDAGLVWPALSGTVQTGPSGSPSPSPTASGAASVGEPGEPGEPGKPGNAASPASP